MGIPVSPSKNNYVPVDFIQEWSLLSREAFRIANSMHSSTALARSVRQAEASSRKAFSTLVNPPTVRPRVVLQRLAEHHNTKPKTSKRVLSLEHSSQAVLHTPSLYEQVLVEQTKTNQPVTSSDAPTRDRALVPKSPARDAVLLLPTSCPGCGGLSQADHAEEAGHYTPDRKAVKSYIREVKSRQAKKSKLESLDIAYREEASLEPPVCDRCHNLTYHSIGIPIAHPSVDSLADTIAESPFRSNHVHHVLDAADFPLSLIKDVHNRLEVARPRTHNRRSLHRHSQRPTLSFLITRADLLFPTMAMSERLMTYFREVLRTALGRLGQNIRLGNVHLVSAKRGWWTQEIKEGIWKEGGGHWMIGKVNVGKSNLFEVLFPKSSHDRAPSYAELERDAQPTVLGTGIEHLRRDPKNDAVLLSEDSLLPPPQPETPYPTMPLVSSLAGTTAGPIRLPFGNHKGEMIDLPGVGRDTLERFVLPKHRLDLVMTHRPTVSQHNIKPNQSLLLGGGLVRITPVFDTPVEEAVVLAYPYVPIEPHVSSTEKAILTQFQQRNSGIRSILAPGAGTVMASAGIFRLETDVTKTRAGPMLRAGVKYEQLPFRIFATDILIEGVGWVELVCQVRRRKRPAPNESPFATLEGADALIALERGSSNTLAEYQPQGQTNTPVDDDFPRPKVEIFTPEGRHVGQRKSMGMWAMWQEGRDTKSARARRLAPRPRRSTRDVRLKARAGKTNARNALVAKVEV